MVVCQQTGAIFNIPNFCINDPLLKKEFVLNEDETNERSIKLKIINFMKNKYYDQTVLNTNSIAELKEILAKEEGVDLEKQNLKVVCKGQLLQDERNLIEYKMEDNDNVQILISNK